MVGTSRRTPASQGRRQHLLRSCGDAGKGEEERESGERERKGGRVKDESGGEGKWGKKEEEGREKKRREGQ